MKSAGRVAPEIGVAMAAGTGPKRWYYVAIVGIIIVLGVVLTASGQNLWQRFFSSLRIEKPKAVTVTIPGFSGSASSRRLQEAIGGMLADTTDVTLDEKDQPAPTQATASQLAGFVVQLPQKRTDPATLIVTGARSVSMTVDRSQLQTIYSEAGDASVSLPASLNGTRVVLKTPKSVRAEYGHCPGAVANTPQGQIQGPPPSTDNGDCIILTQSPPTTADVPAGLDMQQLVGIGLELSGMSPVQRQAFQKIFSWQSVLSMPLPRFMRSYDTVTVNSTPAMLLNTAGRRGPTYELFWANNNIVYSLVGYGSSADAVPVANSLTVPRGEIFGFLGPNGAGKSTSIKMLLGLVHPTSGDSFVLGAPSGDVEIRRKIGFLPEDFRFYDWLTATELVRFHGRLSGMTDEKLRKRVPQVIELVGLEPHKNRRVKGFSKGMLQRVGLAQAIVHEPDIVFLDEPTSGLDPMGRLMVRDILRAERDRGATVFLNSHLLSEIEVTCDRVAFIKNGEVVVSRDLHADLAERIHVDVDARNVSQQAVAGLTRWAEDIEVEPGRLRLSVASRDVLPDIMRHLTASGVDVYGVVQERVSLEQTFVTVMGEDTSL